METFNNVINSGQLVLVDFFAAIGYFIGCLALAIQVHIIIILVIKKNAAKLIKKKETGMSKLKTLWWQMIRYYESMKSTCRCFAMFKRGMRTL